MVSNIFGNKLVALIIDSQLALFRCKLAVPIRYSAHFSCKSQST